MSNDNASIPLNKTCPRCGILKPLEDYHNNRAKKYGKEPYCKDCISNINGRKRRKFYSRDDGTRECPKCNNIYLETNEFFTKNGQGYFTICHECERIRSKLYRDKNIEAKRERDRLYYEKHKNEQGAYRKMYYDKNREKILNRVRKWEAENEDRVKLNSRATQARRRMRLRESDDNAEITGELINELYELQGGKCLYCECELDKFHVDHIIPVKLGGDNSFLNLCVACVKCNRSKAAKLITEWSGFPDE